MAIRGQSVVGRHLFAAAGVFYGPGTNFDPADAIIHVQDAAAATMRALTGAATGIYKIVDDAPGRLREGLPVAAQLLGAPPPSSMDEALARHKLGDMHVYICNEQSGTSNWKAKTTLAWQPGVPSWHLGFRDLYALARWPLPGDSQRLPAARRMRQHRGTAPFSPRHRRQRA